MFRIVFGSLDGSNRGTEYASHINKVVIAGLWDHRNTKVTDAGYDNNGNKIFWLTDNQSKVKPLLVTCEIFKDTTKY